MSKELISVKGIPVLPQHNTIGGNIFWVDSGGDGDDSPNSGTYNLPFKTLDYAIGKCTANNDDVIFIKAGHAETIATATALTLDVAGVAVIGLGSGADRPTFSVGTAATATITISGASVVVKNIIVKSTLDGLNTAITVSGNDVVLDIEHQDTSAAVEADIAIAVTGDRFVCKLRDIGFTAGNQRDQSITLNGVDNARIDIDFYGIVGTSVVDMITAACTDVKVTGTMYVSGTTDGSKDVTDTITGSTWYMDVIDAAAGNRYTGGSAAAVASDDVSAVNAKIGTLTNTGGTATIGAMLGDMANSTLAARLDAIDNFIDTEVASIKTETDQIGTIVNTGGTATIGGALGDVSNVSVATRFKQLSRSSNVALAAADMTGTTTRFTVTGPILVKHLGVLITTVLPAGANTLKFSFTPTGGAATDLSGATDTAAAAQEQIFDVDGVKATALVKTTDVGIMVAANEHMPIALSSGVIQTIFSAGPPASGAATIFMEWEPLTPTATVV